MNSEQLWCAIVIAHARNNPTSYNSWNIVEMADKLVYEHQKRVSSGSFDSLSNMQPTQTEHS
jgi:hypothetical protein